jgi:hypothetical protein
VALPDLLRWSRVVLVAFALAVTGLGLAWLSIRSHDIARAEVALDRRPEPVLVSRVGHLAREGGWFYGRHRWLTALTDADQQRAAEVVTKAGYDSFGLVALDVKDYRPPAIAGFASAASDRLRLFSGIDLRVTTYTRAVR